MSDYIISRTFPFGGVDYYGGFERTVVTAARAWHNHEGGPMEGGQPIVQKQQGKFWVSDKSEAFRFTSPSDAERVACLMLFPNGEIYSVEPANPTQA